MYFVVIDLRQTMWSRFWNVSQKERLTGLLGAEVMRRKMTIKNVMPNKGKFVPRDPA
jgi:hypothetical protein